MLLDRREFLRLQAIGLSGVSALRLSDSWSVEAEEVGPRPLPPDSLVLDASGIPRAAAEGRRLTSGVIAFSLKDASWRLLSSTSGLSRLSPDCRRLAILDVKTNSIWACELSDGATRKLADLHGLPVWSPDSSTLIFSALPPQNAHPRPLAEQTYETWKLKLDGTQPVRVGLSERDFVSDWSADGDWLILRTYLSEPHSGIQISLCRPDGTERRQLTTERAYHSSGRFSPDGKHIAYISQSKEGSSIWVNGLDGKSLRRLLHEPIHFRYQVCWAPDGERVAITRLDTRNNQSTVEIISLKTLERVPLKLPEGHYNYCDWRC